MTGCPVPPTGGSRPNPSEYDYRLIQARLEELRALRRRGEVARLVFCLHEGLHGNLGNIASPALYSQCRFGTKRLLTEYLDEIAVALDYLCDYFYFVRTPVTIR
jgi:TAG lipase/steryl ester hydrolase/phospholipase A2/LPA acyltransferase